jgi:membrane protease YdiL (CAAX protease family)
VTKEQPEVAPEPALVAESVVDPGVPPLSAQPVPIEAIARVPPILPADRCAALIEVVICSGFPTQLIVALALSAAGFRSVDAAGHLSGTWVVALSLVDAALVVGLILSFTRLHGERPREMFLGQRPVIGEGLLGLPLIVVVFALVIVLMAALQGLAPWMHNVPRNPLQDMIRTPRDAWIFGVVVIVSGGIREEIQRAFVLRRFERYLGGAWVGLVLFSAAFGAGHVIQGWDVALTIATLGAFWGLVYLRRRSIAAPVVSHAGFNVLEIFRYTLYGF